MDAIWENQTLKPAPRAAAYAFFRYAKDSPISWCAWSELKRRTGLKSNDAVQAAVAALVDGGWLTEVEKAHQHYAPRYRLTIPAQTSEDRRSEKAPQTSRNRSAESSRPPVSARQTSGFPRARPPDSGEDYSERPVRKTSPRARAERIVAEECPDASEDEIRSIVDALADEATTSLPGYARALAENGDLGQRIRGIRAERERATEAAELETARADPRMRCEHGTDGGRWLRADGTSATCAFCRRAQGPPVGGGDFGCVMTEPAS
ncbi:MAG TPA: hypothetical protein VJT49_14150 [Amycolatopsis sp.]|uniref:hypothetical protein n=1 Tax=Amycolatopsis sp. TaxID=37632 RepID=UPI002B46BD9A|nr:hypothetical protein [Amycolatopsis sp.]HKS46223.1 hypothetical protein [Amycolatopsis sp.]